MRIFFVLTFIVSINCFSQKHTIKVDYTFNLNIGQYQEFQSILYVDKKKSLFLWNNPIVRKVEDENNISINLNELDSIGSFNFRLFSKDSLFSRIPYFNRKVLLLKEKTPEINWKIINEVKKIGDYNCQKAIAKFRGRDYIAWFTSEIPIRSGPWKLHGLPGLILIAYDTSKEIQFVFTSISKSYYKISPILKADQIIGLSEYKKMSKSSSKDFFKKLKSKLPRGAKIKITSKKGIEKFD